MTNKTIAVEALENSVDTQSTQVAQFRHMYDIGFTVVSNCEYGSDVTVEMLAKALLERINNLQLKDYAEACGEPSDSFEE